MTVIDAGVRPAATERPDATVMIVDDHRVLRETLFQSLDALGVVVVATAASGHEALESVARLCPRVVLLDVSLPDMDGVAVLRRLRAEHPATAVVMLSMFADGQTSRDALAAGAAAYLTKDTSTAEIAETLRRVAAGAPPTGSDERVPGGTPPAADEYALSRRELEVLQLIAEGKSTPAVARELFISVKTVKNHLANVYAKLDVCDRTQAVVQGLRMGLVHLR